MTPETGCDCDIRIKSGGFRPFLGVLSEAKGSGGVALGRHHLGVMPGSPQGLRQCSGTLQSWFLWDTLRWQCDLGGTQDSGSSGFLCLETEVAWGPGLVTQPL